MFEHGPWQLDKLLGTLPNFRPNNNLQPASGEAE